LGEKLWSIRFLAEHSAPCRCPAGRKCCEFALFLFFQVGHDGIHVRFLLFLQGVATLGSWHGHEKGSLTSVELRSGVDTCGRYVQPEFRRAERMMTFFVFFIMAVPLATHERAPQTMAFEVSGGEIQITFPAEPMKVSRQELVEWVRTAARAVSHYYGKFPVP